MIKRYSILVLLILLFVGCKSTKRVSGTAELKERITSSQLIKEHKRSEVKFKTLQSKVRVEYIEGKRSQSHSVSLRMEKDKVIWLSATLGVVRVKITPNRLSYYNKLDNTYFDGDFALISDFLGTELNFQNIQSLLLGEALFNLDKDRYQADLHQESYLLFPEDQNGLFEIFFLLNPSHYKMDSQQLSQPEKMRMLQIDYENYQKVDRQIIPEKIRVIALEEGEETIVSMELKSISLNNELRFPFRIPSGFERIEIK